MFIHDYPHLNAREKPHQILVTAHLDGRAETGVIGFDPKAPQAALLCQLVGPLDDIGLHGIRGSLSLR